ncbi:MAG: YeeE/YedE family protein [Fibrobacterota bacterium]|nr:YeeE/YedE family protein [Fibrobacterota bacterium]
MFEAVLNPWPWYVSGPLIGLTVPMLLLLTGKAMGISSSFQDFCTTLFARDRKVLTRQSSYFKEHWKMVFALGLVLGGFVASHFLSLEQTAFLPESYHSLSGAAILGAGGFLVGFGSRYAEGCTSGHAITGLASLQWASLLAVIGFFAGGLAAAGITMLLG